MDFFSLDNTFFDAWNYKVSYLEFSGLVTGLVAVLLAAMGNVWNWPLGIIYVVLMMVLFYQVQLYPDMMLHIYFLITNIIGWWRWKHPRKDEADRKEELRISWLNGKTVFAVSILIAAGTILLGLFASNLHHILPWIFTQPSAAPYIDSFITVTSVIAAYYMIEKKVEAWIMYLLVDIIGVYLYFIRDIKLTSLLYLIYCVLASFALVNWIRMYRGYEWRKAENTR
jgi:nicotinamide mononucleotide transporter